MDKNPAQPGPLPQSLSDKRDDQKGDKGIVVEGDAKAERLESFDEIDLFELLRKVIAGWKAMSILTLLTLCSAIFYLRNATPVYSSFYQITPAASSAGGVSGKLGNIGGLAALAGVSLGGQGSAASSFDLYLEFIKSRALAETLAQDPYIMQTVFTNQWDAPAKQWREPKGFVVTAVKTLKRFAGEPQKPWQPPNSEDLQKVLAQKIIVAKPATKGPDIYKISFNHSNPAFARYVLARINSIADARVRADALTRATRYADYLSKRLSTVVIAELRKDLSDALAEQEKSIMLASSDSSYAAIMVSGVYSDSTPVSPKYLVILMLSIAIGLFIGVLYALIDFKELGNRLFKQKT
jgi:LPS O-antigen subunit length determinant protein (WzzB/FepE family)